jgi:glucosamine-6-phosphate deaminase
MELKIAETRTAMGEMAAKEIAAAMRERLASQAGIRVVFAAAPSQSEMLRALVAEPGIDWARVSGFHMDEYIGLSQEAPQRFGLWLREAIFDRVPLRYHLIEPASDLQKTCDAYAEMLHAGPIDFVLLGVGMNGHLAFNDPPADLNDKAAVKVVELDELCRRQQVEDGCFAAIGMVPKRAVTLTVPELLRGDRMFCCVPGALKAKAVRAMMTEPVSGACPATALRGHPRCTVYLDRESAAEL